jgi:hypothetical protein
MSNTNFIRARFRSVAAAVAAVLFVLISTQVGRAASWKGIEPFVSKRTDVERVLGAPISDRMGEDGTLKFSVSGGTVTIFFVTPKFIASKKLPAKYEGTVLQIVLSHDNANDTPESMNLVANKAFKRQGHDHVETFTDEKEGLIYTFVDSRLKTTRYAYSMEQLGRIQRGK